VRRTSRWCFAVVEFRSSTDQPMLRVQNATAFLIDERKPINIVQAG
jgi:hypothetical protein